MIMLWIVENNIKVNEINKIANYFYKNTTYQFQHTIQYFNKVHKKIIDHDKFQRMFHHIIGVQPGEAPGRHKPTKAVRTY